MDALYGDLENYNEVNIVEELRNENRDLKLKLEEYETAIGKLQKDYDKLVLEFNNLQTNYSSLLKTARAEVERKAQMITQLNIEKDMMVLKTLQNANNRKFHSNFKPNQKKTTSSETVKANVDKKTKPEHSDNNDRVNKGELKENVAVHNPKTHANSIKDRRKSMSSSSIPHLTKDQHSDENKTQKLKDTPKEICSTSNFKERLNKISNERFINRTSDTASLSGRSSNSQELCRDGNRRAPYKDFNREQFKRDKIRESDRFSEKIDEYKEGDKIRESYSNKKDDKTLDIRQNEEGDKCSEGDKFTEGDKCKEVNKFRDKNRDVDRLREGEHLRESDTVRGDEKFCEHEKYLENENINKNSNKYRMGDKCRESDKYRESDRYREGDRYRESDRYREGDRYKESDRYREADRSRESDRYREADRSRESDRYREADKSRESDRYIMTDKYKDSDKFKEDDKYFHAGKFRNREKIDPPHRFKRHYSPDRPIKRNYRESQDDSKQEYGRYRVLGSSTSESHSLSHTRSHEKQLFFEGQKHKSETHKHLHESTHAERLSLSDNQDEPFKKRQKFEYEIRVDEHRQHHDREPLIKPSCSMSFDTLATSCQSPDAVFSPDSYTDTQTAHTIKEIRNTATTHLEDPRLISKRYVLKTENGTSTLTSAASQCINIKPVDKLLWNIQSVAMPEALLKEPRSNIAEECIKEIYMDIDIPESNASIETGEIVDDIMSSNVIKDKDFEKCLEVNETTEIAAKSVVVSTSKTRPENIQKITLPSKMSDEISINQQYDVPKDLPSIICDDNLTKKIVKDNQYSSTSHSSLPQLDEHDISAPEIHMSKKERHRRHQISSSEIAMVQDDLELSDETSDNLDYNKHATEKEKEQSTFESKKTNDLYSESMHSFKITPVANVEVVDNTPNENLKESDGHKKQRSKKRKIKEKEVDEKTPVTQRKVKSKKDKELKPKPITSKFSDLFGDSSSLITPADLGIPSDCVPLCEDAQDAVDINIQEVVATQSSAKDLQLNESIPNRDRDCDTKISKEITESLEVHDATSNVDANIIYQNLNAEIDLNKPDIVKTVIISSGVQPQIILESGDDTTHNRGENVDINKQSNISFHQVAVDTESKKEPSLKALATSTPHKELPISNAMGPECVNIPSQCTSGSIDTNKPGVNQSNINAQESLDAPDVRIFVRRRKKAVKKP